ncbi:MAG: hypothetical protein ACRD3W_28315, partial [Terriglobales bacterium]
MPVLTSKLFDRATEADKVSTLKQLAQLTLDEPAFRSTAVNMASSISKSNPELVQDQFISPIETALSDHSRDFSWRFNTARAVADVLRNTYDSKLQFVVPEMRMPKMADLTPDEQRALRTQTEGALRDPEQMRTMLGNGTLGRLFPEIFGFHESEGGIVGRPQHGGHEFTIDEHSLRLLDVANNHPLFNTLPPYDQTNLLWATLSHDIGKRAGITDPDHEWASGNLIWGVLRTMGYSQTRINRIADLISRHSEVSYYPGNQTWSRLQNGNSLDDIATFYRHPNALTQLRIMNEADIKSINGTSSFWRQEVADELDRVRDKIGQRVQKLNQNMVPVLTSELPQQYGLV